MEISSRTIAAISTPPGKGGVALIRVSGDDAIRIASACFSPKSGKPLETCPSRYAVYGDIHNPVCARESAQQNQEFAFPTEQTSDKVSQKQESSSPTAQPSDNVSKNQDSSSPAAQTSDNVSQIQESFAPAAQTSDKVIQKNDSPALCAQTFVGSVKCDGASPVAFDESSGSAASGTLDDGIATLFRAPASYTGEDTVEITCHGGVLVTQAVLEALYRAGACPAERGEFTRRAFLSGRLSLTDAEAVAQLLDATNPEQLKLVAADGRRLLSGAVGELYARLTRILSSVFARIDYPDEDLGEYTDAQMESELASVKADIDRLAGTYATGRAISCGVETVIVGAPNVGKSSVYNALAGEDLAIVTDIAGTTRDTLQTALNLGRIPLKISDTAGIRETDDPVESIGVSRAAARLWGAELLLAVFDGSRRLEEEDRRVLSLVRAKPDGVKIALINKSDLPRAMATEEIADAFSLVLEVSAKNREGFEALTSAVDRRFTDGSLTPGDDAIVFSARQHAALYKSAAATASALDALRRGVPADAVCGEIEGAMRAMGELDGRAVSEDVVTDIFSRFCVGK